MGMRACAVALWCAVVVAARAAAYTVDCNPEFTDCETELSKLTSEDDEIPSLASKVATPNESPPASAITTVPSTSTPKIETTTEQKIEVTTKLETETEATESKAKARLLNLNVDDLQSFANALHNQSQDQEPKKSTTDLSDLNLDDEDDEPPRIDDHHHKHEKHIPDKFYSNLQAPFSPILTLEKASEEIDMSCKDNGISYKIGDRIERGCEEICECSPGSVFDCSPRCKHPYIRRGRRLNDPLCFESPVDDCCSIIACATGNSDIKATKVEVCRYGNATYPVGTKWEIGCDQRCSCETNSIVTCKPRCSPLPQSDKCINVQDPHDECCEVQICDVSQDAHEEPLENVTSSTTTTTTTTTTTEQSLSGLNDLMKPTIRPLVLIEPIGSVKVLQNNTVQVNLMQMNKSDDPIHLLMSSDGGRNFDDVELKYSNLILNLEAGKDYILKTKETGTKFNFTITATDGKPQESNKDIGKIGCYQDGKLYPVGEEFHIGCTELCECTGPDTRECVDLICPSHVGLEILSKGCVRWAPSPPPQPPNCCPRSARCLSDGTCKYKGTAIPNWTEVPISLTGCEQRCFCENGELDCQEVCTPLPPVPPQTFRCPPMHRPAAVNISDEDCCKQWGCVPNAAEDTNGSTLQTYVPFGGQPVMNFVTPVLPTTIVPPAPSDATDSTDFYRHLHPVKSYPKLLKTVIPVSFNNDAQNYLVQAPNSKPQGENITVFTLDDIDSPFKIIRPDPKLSRLNVDWEMHPQNRPKPAFVGAFQKLHRPHMALTHTPNFVLSDDLLHNVGVIQQPKTSMQSNVNTMQYNVTTNKNNKYHELPSKVPMSKVDNLDLFLPTYSGGRPNPTPQKSDPRTRIFEPIKSLQSYFAPAGYNRSADHLRSQVSQNSLAYNTLPREYSANGLHGKQLTILRSKDLSIIKQTNNRDRIWGQDTKAHVLFKAPNPYETVLLRAIPTLPSNQNSKIYVHPSTLDLEHLVSQMEVESEVNKNLGRSADKIQDDAEGQTHQNTSPASRPQQPSFLPTIPPEIHFPQDEIPDYDQNNLHRPVNPMEPVIPVLPIGLPIPPNYGEENKKLTVITLQSDSPTSVKMLFGLPPVLVGLRGSVDLRYTDKTDEDITHWYSQVFAPADEVLTTPRLEFRLTGLKPSTIYKIRGKLYLHNLPVEPESEVFSVRTQDLPTMGPVEEKRREIDSRLTVVDVNDTAAHVSWRHFTEDELRFIDGIQVRYRPVGTPIYSMTELLHHSRSLAELHDLRPGSRYEASLVLVPPPRATTELHDPGRVEFTTGPSVDPYNWTVTIEARVVGSEAAELTWRGVPSPAERWVRVYRAAHACGATRKEHDAFRLAARDLPPTILLTGLESNTRCRVWLELFLTNGKVRTSNVLEINTKPQDSPAEVDNEIEASSIAGSRGSPRGDYYGALVVVGVVAALGALTSLLLLLVLVRRHRPHSVAITPLPSAPRDSSLPPYDNPAYKLELQQETMDLAAKMRAATGDPLCKEYLVQRISLAIQRGNAASVLGTMDPSPNL